MNFAVKSRFAWWARGKTPLKNDGLRQLRDDDSNPRLMGKVQKWQPNHQPDYVGEYGKMVIIDGFSKWNNE